MKLLHAKIKFNYFNFFLLVLVFNTNFFSLKSFAATITSSISGNWSNTATWVGGVVPTSADVVVIAATHLITVDNNYTCLELRMNNPGNSGTSSVTISSGKTLTVNGNVTTNYNASASSGSTSTIDVG